ncbi:NUDIX hydrolase [Microbacterium sp.]|uniref:NUDIX hydrolase n=1 Tax=Microbacterium sp. TaxID=51671 RepID=UPI003F70C844
MPDDASPADRALRALGDAVGESRPRVATDGADPDIPVAATVVLLRDAAEGPEVLLIERPDRGSFAGAWVFPGGKLDPADHDATDTQEWDAARRAAVRETAEETGLVIEVADLVTLSVWDPPPGIPLRIRTWFFLCAAPDGDLVLSAAEAVSARWERPSEILDRHARGELTLYPPTWVTLHGLARGRTSAEVMDAAERAGVERFDSVARRGPTGPMLLWQGDGQYAVADAEASARHRLEVGVLPWVYSRGE